MEEWLNQDRQYLSFRASILKITQFVSSNFNIVNNMNIKEISNVIEWFPIITKNHSTINETTPDTYYESVNKQDNESKALIPQQANSSQQNMIIKNKLIKLLENELHLRSLSVQCEVNLLMSGESEFFIFTRCGDKFTSKTAVCYISKELESARKFVSFAVLEEKEEGGVFIIRNIKKQEIPRQTYIKDLDISEIKFTFVDNGDNKCFLFLDEQTHQNSNLVLVGDFYEPYEQPSNIIFGSIGDLISIKKLNIKQTFRNAYMNFHNAMKTNPNVQACGCCNIF